MNNSARISIIGAGNVGSHLCKALSAKGVNIIQVVSRTLCHGTQSALGAGAEVINRIEDLDVNVDALIVCVPDDAIVEVLEKVPKNIPVAHTSGTQSIDLMANMGFDHCGIFYPLQTFNKDRELSFTEIPMLIEANNTRFQEFLVQTAERISEKVRIVHSDDRKQIHLAAVFACNFANCLWGIADEIMTERDLSFDLLRPLLFETLQKALDNKPHDVQTGPAQRGDAKTIEAHMNKLSNEQQKEIYQLMTKYIIDKKNLHG